MQGLIPEKRRDKHGKLVTRYVRPAGPAQAFSLLPAPVTPRPQSDAESDWESAKRVAALIFPGARGQEPLRTVSGVEQHEFGFEEAQDALVGMLGGRRLSRVAALLESAPEGSRARRLMASALYPDVEDRAVSSQNEELYAKAGAGPLPESEVAGVADSIEIAAAVDAFAGPGVTDEKLLTHMYNAARSVWRETTANGGQRWQGAIPGPEGYRKLVFSEFLTSFVAGDRIEYTGSRDAREVYAERMAMVENAQRIRRHQEVLRERRRIDVALLDELDRVDPAIGVGAL